MVAAGTGPDCTAECSLEIEAGSRLVLLAKPGAGFFLEGWSGDCEAETADSCTLTVNRNLVLSAAFTPANIVFVTSVSRAPARLGGLQGADDLCVERAKAANLRGSIWKAWLSTASQDPRKRFATARGWIRPDGKPFADRLEDLTDQTQRGAVSFYPPSLDELGRDVGSAEILTCSVFGRVDCNGDICGPEGREYTAVTDPYITWGKANEGWEQNTASSGACERPLRLLCLGADFRAQVRPGRPPAASKLAFTSWGVPPSAGRAKMDEACARDALNAKIEGTFLAVLAATGTSAASRFDLDSGPYYRPDGVFLSATARDLLMGRLAAGPIAFAYGFYTHVNGHRLWTGASSPFVAASDATNCQNWSTDAATASSQVGVPVAIGPRLFSAESIPCSDLRNHVLCLQK